MSNAEWPSAGVFELARQEMVTERPAVPRLVVSEHVVTPDELPRGPRTVANVVDHEAWTVTWLHAETEELERPKRGGVSHGLKFVEARGRRHGWAGWVAGKFLGAYVYSTPRSIVPVKLSAADLKGLLS